MAPRVAVDATLSAVNEAAGSALEPRVRVSRVVPGAVAVGVLAHVLHEGRPDVPGGRVLDLHELDAVAAVVEVRRVVSGDEAVGIERIARGADRGRPEGGRRV